MRIIYQNCYKVRTLIEIPDIAIQTLRTYRLEYLQTRKLGDFKT